MSGQADPEATASSGDDLLDFLTSEATTVSGTAAADTGVDRFHRPAEQHFRENAPTLARLGWAVFPQTADSSRRPGIYRGEMIKWISGWNLHEAPKDELEARRRVKAVDDWAAYCGDLNVAAALGPGSGGVVGIDIDVKNEAWAHEIVSLCESILGPTPLRRVGSYPKVLLLYRQDPDDGEEPIANIGRKFEPGEGDDPNDPDGIDILFKGKAATFFGVHHKTGNYFKWTDRSPLDVAPTELPVVTATEVMLWLEQVDARRRFHRTSTYDAGAMQWEWDDSSEIRVPKMRLAAGGSPWVEDEDGIVTDGREQYMAALVWNMVRANPSKEPGLLTNSVVEEFKATAKCDGRWSESRLPGEVSDRVKRLKAKIEKGEVSPDARGRRKGQAPDKDEVRTRQMSHLPPRRNADDIGALSFLPPREREMRRPVPGKIVEEPPADWDASEPDLDKTRKQVADEVGEVLDTFFDEVYQRFSEGRVGYALSGVAVIDEDGVEGAASPGAAFAPDGALFTLPESAYGQPEALRVALTDTFGRVKEASLRVTRALVEPYADVSTSGPLNAEVVSAECGVTVRVRAGDPDPPPARVHILKAPTGSGKTSRTISYIARDKRRLGSYPYMSSDGERQRGKLPILFLLPTYNNIGELRQRAEALNLDPDASDAELKRQASDAGIVHESEMDDRLADLREQAFKAGLRTMTYKGKIAAGCQMAEKVKIAMEAGMGTSTLCEAEKVEENGEKRTVYCPYYHNCEAIRQRFQIKDSDVVFLPHAFMSLSIPEELKDVRCVIADERVHHLFLHTTTLSLRTLHLGRKAPKLTKKDEREEVTQEDLLQAREQAVEEVFRAYEKGECPVNRLFKLRDDDGAFGGRRALEMVDRTLKVCSSALRRDGTVTPETSEEELREICERPTGVELREEHRFWSIVKERIEALQADRLPNEQQELLKAELARDDLGEARRTEAEEQLQRVKSIPRRAKGDREHRLQFVIEEGTNGEKREKIRLSWRTEPNWIDRPMLLLDASAAVPIIRKIWGDRDVVPHDVNAHMRVRVVGVVDRTYSNSSIVGSPDMSKARQARAAKQLAQVRDAVSSIAAMFSNGRVVAGSSIIVRRAVNNCWKGPENVDWTHFGALRGLDFAKHHAAAVSIGRMEVPFRTIDGLVAALTYDDDEPEQPFDRRGNGLDRQGQELSLPMEARRLRMRDGHVFEVPTPVYPGKWAKMIQSQYREEELNQFVGRLRPVYREGEMPVWFALSSVIPEGVIVDDFLCLDDLLRSGPGDRLLAEACRRLEGVLDPTLVAGLCGDIFSDERAVRRKMSRAGFKEDKAVGRAAHAFAPVKWRLTSDGRWHTAWVAAHRRDYAHAVASAIEAALGVPEGAYEIADVPKPVASAAMRKNFHDQIDEDLGDRDQREEAEEHIRLQTAEETAELGAFEDMGWSPPLEYPAGREETLAQIKMSHADWDARAATQDLWRKLGLIDDTVTPSVIPDEEDVFEQLGAEVYDDAAEDDIPW